MTSLRSICARPDSPVVMSMLGSGLRSVDTGFWAARTTIGSPLLMPPSMPPARFDVRRQPAPSASTTSWTALPGRSTTPNPRPISTPFTPGMAMTAPASWPSSRVSHSDELPRPTGTRSATTTNEPPIESPASFARSTASSIRASASESGHRSGDGSRRSRSGQSAGMQDSGSSASGNARTGPSWSTNDQTRTPIAASSCRASEPATTRGVVERADARSRTSRTSSVPYFSAPARSTCPGRARVIGFGRRSDGMASTDMRSAQFSQSRLPTSKPTGEPRVRP